MTTFYTVLYCGLVIFMYIISALPVQSSSVLLISLTAIFIAYRFLKKKNQFLTQYNKYSLFIQ
jgi:hypothetical protein